MRARSGQKVIGEGANLALTQKARIEFALAGGRINTDAVDNSAGVNSSDIEVNIKIALASAERASKLDRPSRNEFLAAMTPDVALLVLRNNYLQTLCLSLAVEQGTEETVSPCSLCTSLNSKARSTASSNRFPPTGDHRPRSQGPWPDAPRIRDAYGLCEDLARSRHRGQRSAR